MCQFWYKLITLWKDVPSIVLSSFNQNEDLALKSPRIMVSKELVEIVLLRSSSKSDRRFSNIILAWGHTGNTNISFTVLQGYFSYNTLTYVW